MLLLELWSLLIHAQGWEQQGSRVSHYGLPVFSYVSITASWGFSVGRLS